MNAALDSSATWLNFCWGPDWVRPYESLWGLVHRFAIANCLTAEAVARLFASPRAPQLSRDSAPPDAATREVTCAPWRANRRDLRMLGRLSRDVGHRILCVSESALHHAVILKTPGFAEADAIYRRTLAYCSQCMSAGYHTMVHQLTSLRRCPIHESDLVLSCPACKKPISMGLYAAELAHPLSCPACSYRITPCEDGVPATLPFSIEPLRELVELLRLRSRILCAESKLVEDEAKVRCEWISFWKDVRDDKLQTMVIPLAPSEQSWDSSDCRYWDLEKELGLQGVYSDVRRSIRAEHEVEHRDCENEAFSALLRSSVMLPETRMCAHARAYFAWRSLWEQAHMPQALTPLPEDEPRIGTRDDEFYLVQELIASGVPYKHATRLALELFKLELQQTWDYCRRVFGDDTAVGVNILGDYRVLKRAIAESKYRSHWAITRRDNNVVLHLESPCGQAK